MRKAARFPKLNVEPCGSRPVELHDIDVNTPTGECLIENLNLEMCRVTP